MVHSSNALPFAPQATQRARARWEEGQKSATEKAAAEAVEEREKALEDARRVRPKHQKALMYVSTEHWEKKVSGAGSRMPRQRGKDLFLSPPGKHECFLLARTCMTQANHDGMASVDLITFLLFVAPRVFGETRRSSERRSEP